VPLRIPLRVVFYRDAENWVAHCLEFDLLGHGVEPFDALSSLSGAIETQSHWAASQGDPSLLFSAAPSDVEVMFAAGEDFAPAVPFAIAAPPGYSFEHPRVRLRASDVGVTQVGAAG
jgi:hypothetical protein